MNFKWFKLFLYLVTLSLFCSTIKLIDYRREIDFLLKKYLQEMNNDYKLLPYCIGARAPNEYTGPNFKFSVDEKLNIDETRKLYLTVTNKLLEKFNSNISIRPFLHQYPMDINNLDLSIRFMKNDSNYVESSYIAYVHSFNGYIRYFIFNPITKDLDIYYEEAYVEAQKKIK